MSYAHVSWVDSNMVHALVARVFWVVVIDIFCCYMVLDDGAYASDVSADIGHIFQVGSRGRIDTLNKAFGCRVATKEDKPTNGEFIAMIADKLALEQRTA